MKPKQSFALLSLLALARKNYGTGSSLFFWCCSCGGTEMPQRPSSLINSCCALVKASEVAASGFVACFLMLASCLATVRRFFVSVAASTGFVAFFWSRPVGRKAQQQQQPQPRTIKHHKARTSFLVAARLLNFQTTKLAKNSKTGKRSKNREGTNEGTTAHQKNKAQSRNAKTKRWTKQAHKSEPNNLQRDSRRSQELFPWSNCADH